MKRSTPMLFGILLGLCNLAGMRAMGTSVVARDPAGTVRNATGRHRSLAASEAVKKSLPLLQKSAQLWTQRANCTSCHHQSLGSLAIATARERGFKVNEGMAREQVEAVVRRRSEAALSMFEGAGAINGQIGFSYALLGLAAENSPPNELTDAMVHFLLLRQAKDGGWVSESHRPPLEDARETATALTIRGLLLYAPPQRRDEVSHRVSQAREWLLNSKPLQHEGRVMRLLGLVWSSAPRHSIQAAVDDIVARQRMDGGWEQLPTQDSDAYATGESLVALRVAGLSHDHPAIRRGAAYLCRNQMPDGSWRVRTRRKASGLPYFETGYPHGEDQFISYAASAWCTVALACADNSRLPLALTRTRLPNRKSANYRYAADPKANRLFTAIVFGSLADVRRALNAGADPNSKNFKGATPLHWAAFDAEKTRLLIARGAEVNARTASGKTPLMIAALAYRGMEALRVLLNQGADPNSPASNVPGSLACAIFSLNREKTALLLEHGAKVETTGDIFLSPLGIAALSGDLKTVQQFLPHVKSFDQKDEDGYGLLEDAIFMANEPLTRAYLEAGADPNRPGDGGKTALHWAAMFNVGDGRIVKTLLAHGANTSLKTKSGKTARELAIENKNSSVVPLLR